MRRHDVTAVRHRLPTTLAVSSSPRGKSWRHETPRRHHGRPAPAPEEKDSLWPLGHRKKTDGLWWVGVCFWRPPWSRVRASGDLGHSIGVSEVGQSQVNDGRSFLCVCGVFFVVDFCDVTVSPTHRKKRPRVPRAVPSFSEHRNSVLLRCAMQNEASILSFRKPPIRGSVTNCVVYFGDPSHRSVGLKWARRAGGSETVAKS